MSVDRSSSQRAAHAPGLYEHNFGKSPPLSLGVEEELLLVDDENRLLPAAEQVLDSVSGAAAARVSSEIFAGQIELKTGICFGVDEALAQLRETRRSIGAAGFALMGSGLHPADRSTEAQLIAKPRYAIVRQDLAACSSRLPADCTSTSASPTRRPRCGSPTPSASTCRCCRR